MIKKKLKHFCIIMFIYVYVRNDLKSFIFGKFSSSIISDLRKLILKKLRFRDLEDVSYPREYDELSKLYDLSPLDTSGKT